jgi:hypothetical protein
MAKQSPLLVEVTELFKERKKKLGTKPEPLKSTKLKSEEELEVIKGVLKAELAAYSRADWNDESIEVLLKLRYIDCADSFNGSNKAKAQLI